MAIINLGSRSLKIAIFVVLLMIGVGTWALVKPTTVKGPIYSESVVQRRDIATKIEPQQVAVVRDNLENEIKKLASFYSGLPDVGSFSSESAWFSFVLDYRETFWLFLIEDGTLKPVKETIVI